MSVFAISSVAARPAPDDPEAFDLEHSASMWAGPHIEWVEAQAMIRIVKLYPPADGWKHSVSAIWVGRK